MKKLVFLLFLLVAFFVSLPGLALAQTDQGPEAAVVSEGQIVEGAFFAAAPTVVIAGTVNGDVYVAGGEVLVSGIINGDLLGAAGVVTVTGNVAEDIRVITGQLVVTGPVGGNITAAAGMVTLAESANVADSVVAGAGMITVLSPVGREIAAAAGQITVGNSVGNGIRAATGQLTLTPSANVAGNIEVISDFDVQVQPGAQVGGEISRNQPTRAGVDEERVAGIISRAALTFLVIDFVSSLVLGLLLLWLFPATVQAIVESLYQRPLSVLGAGVLAFILIPLIAFVLLLVVIGIPLALILWVLYLIALYLSKIFVFLAIGQLILKNVARGWALALGLVIYEILAIVPFIGPFIVFLTILFGLGMIVFGLKNIYQAQKEKNLV